MNYFQKNNHLAYFTHSAVKLRWNKFAFSETCIMFVMKLRMIVTSVIPFFRFKLHPPVRSHPILVRVIALRQDPKNAEFSETSNHNENDY